MEPRLFETIEKNTTVDPEGDPY
jgi:hypothetical protein